MKNKLHQRLIFSRNNKHFSAIYKKLQRLGKEPYLMPFWAKVNENVEQSLLPKPRFNFLDSRAIKDTMFVDGNQLWLDTQVNFLQSKLGKSMKTQLKEDSIGSPKLLKSPLNFTSHNTIHHLYHIYVFLDKTHLKTNDIKNIVEWGGGYGNFAKLWWRLAQGNCTYTIVDSALFCSIQWLYLSSIFGQDSVNLINKKGCKIIGGKINLVPLALLQKIDIKGELFVSTWGLSESASKAQDFVVKDRDWFGAKHLLIGFQDSNKDIRYASRLGELAEKSGAKIIDIKFIPDNHYAIK